MARATRIALGTVPPLGLIPLLGHLGIAINPRDGAAEGVEGGGHPYWYRPRQSGPCGHHQTGIGGADALPVRTVFVVGGHRGEPAPTPAVHVTNVVSGAVLRVGDAL